MENQEGRINYRWPNICIYIKFADKILYKNILEMVICFPIFSAHLTQSHSRCMENNRCISNKTCIFDNSDS